MSVLQGGVLDVASGAAEEAAARQRAATSIGESLVVEAGAGTGKTTLLITRIINLLRSAKVDEPPRPLRLSEIVAITFTEKAAGELKTRLRDVLETAQTTGRLLGQPIPESEQDLWSDALQELDRAVVATIHAFCAGMIRERPVEAGIDPGRKTADALTQALLFEEAWLRWREQAYENADDSILASALSLKVKADRGGPADRSVSIRDVAESLVNNRDLLEFLPAPIDDRAAWNALKPRIDDCVAQLQECLKHTKPTGQPDKASRLASEFLEQWAPIHEATLDQARAILVHNVQIPAEVGGYDKRWRDPAKLEQLRGLLAVLRDQLLPDATGALTHNLMVALANRLSEFVESYECLKRKRELLDFQDLLLIARNMLRSSAEAREYFRDRFRVLLIDEFQDTDPLQAEVVMLLAGSSETEVRGADHGRLFLVGDPKQSIYRFRRADIEVFDQCTEWVGAERTLRIRQNFRSGALLIRWFNSVFSQLIEKSQDGHYQPEYSPLLSGPTADDAPGRVVLLPPPEPARGCRETIDQVRYREGCCIALFIQQAIKEEWPCSGRTAGIQLGDVAVLLPQTTGLEQYEEAFRACGLRYHISGGKHFYQRIEVKSLINVLTAIDNPEDGIAVVGALRSPFFGCSDEDLLRHAANGGTFNYRRPRVAPVKPLDEIFQLFDRLHGIRNQRPVAALLLDFFDSTKGLETFLTKPHGEWRVANLLKIVDAARSMSRAEVLTFRGFSRWLRERLVAREEEAESLQAEPGENAVRILTIHKSKGLEFPMTVIADLYCGDARPDDRIIFDRINGRLQLRCGPIRTADWREAQQWDLLRAEAERRRLFYVATTRARDYLVLPVFWRKPNEYGGHSREPTGLHRYLEQIPGLLPPEEDMPWGKQWDDALVFDTRGFPPWPSPSQAPRVDYDEWAKNPAVEKFLIDRADWQRERDALIARAGQSRPVRRAKELAVVPIVAVPRRPSDGAGGHQFGTLVHRLIEFNMTGRVRAEQLHEIAGPLGLQFGLTEDAAQLACKMAADAANTPVGQRLRAARRVMFEVPFTYADGETIVEGRMDALAEEDDGLLLVDFKTDRVEPGGEAELAACYSGQIQAYASAVRAATGKSVRSSVILFLRTGRAVEIGSPHPCPSPLAAMGEGLG
jgi:ATP-dependent helicase/nuclease subunit A